LNRSLAPRISVLVVDDQPLVRKGNSLVLDATEDIVVVAEAENGEDATAIAVKLNPQVVLMDVRMPGIGGIEATRRITHANPDIRVIVLTTFDIDEYAFGGLDAGASAFLLKSTTPELLAAAVRTVAAGEAVVEPRITKHLIDVYTKRHIAVGNSSLSPAGEATELLTPRELDVLTAIGQGLSNTEICSRLHLSPATVKTHINRVFSKLNLRDRAQAIIYTYRHGISQ
jgi:DNA-binding NarL/FixJ family response regulator